MPAPTASNVLELLEPKNAPVLSLLALCRTPDYLGVWLEGPKLIRRFARLLLKQGHPTLALEVASRGLDKSYQGDPELLYCQALALVNSGNSTRADKFVQAMLKRTDLPADIHSEVLSLAGRIRKDVASRTDDPNTRSKLLFKAFSYYLQAYEKGRDTFPGINAATLALLSGEREQSLALAGQVRVSVLDKLEQPGKDSDYWLLATLGEAYLLLGDKTGAKTRYARATSLARETHNDGDIASMRRQILVLRAHLPIGDDLLGLFDLGPVVVFAGHGLDRPGEPFRFPVDPAMEAVVRRAIKHELEALGTNIGYCSPGCGSDILFGEVMRDRDAELHLVLPYNEGEFIRERVTYGLAELEAWRKRYEKLRGFLRVPTHFATKEEFLNDQVLHDFAGTFMQGLALTRAAQVGVQPVALVVQDTSPHSGSSGLTTFIENWKRTNHELRIIDLAALRSSVQLTTTPLPALPEQSPARTPRRMVQAMLFADVSGFSGLPESHLPDFFIELLKIVVEELESTHTLLKNTWGDGLYIVFADVVICADFALRLLRRMEKFNFAAFDFRLDDGKEPGVRIGLHTGPVFKGFDAVMGKDNYFGNHVSRAARIEPVTAPGCAFVSEQFAAALALAQGHRFVCEYLGLQPLAKEYDNTCPLYQLTERTDNSGLE